MSTATLKTASQTKGRVLAVEDDRTSLRILTTMLEKMDYEVLQAENGREALEVIEREAYKLDVILLDKSMPEMNGLEVVEVLKDDPKARHIPIIMVTGSDTIEEVKEGIDAGVFYYITKPYEEDLFQSIVISAMREADRRTHLKTELAKHQTSFGFMKKAEFAIKKLSDAEDLACFIANCFPNPDTALPGLASLLLNAVEHGNLNIGYDDKTELLNEGRWREEVEKRENDASYSDKFVTVVLEKSDQEARVVITDEGDGFDWKSYMEIDPARALDSHGRGIAQANKISFDTLTYNKSGNVVTAVSRFDGGIKW